MNMTSEQILDAANGVGRDQRPSATTPPLITDEQRLVGAKTRFDNKIAIYDDGFGGLFIHRDTMGISGIVRAQTWNDAHSICEDEFYPEASETIEEMKKDYSTVSKHERELDDQGNFKGWKRVEEPCEDFTQNAAWQENFGYRPNGPRAGKRDNGEPRDPLGHGIYAKDLNGDSLDRLTPELMAELGITLEITPWDLEVDEGAEALKLHRPSLAETRDQAAQTRAEIAGATVRSPDIDK